MGGWGGGGGGGGGGVVTIVLANIFFALQLFERWSPLLQLPYSHLYVDHSTTIPLTHV